MQSPCGAQTCTQDTSQDDATIEQTKNDAQPNHTYDDEIIEEFVNGKAFTDNAKAFTDNAAMRRNLRDLL